MRLEKRRLEELKEYENNPRIIDKAVPLVAESIFLGMDPQYIC